MKNANAVLIGLTAWVLASAINALALPVPDPLYWLDVSDHGSLNRDADTGELLTLSDKSGHGYDFERRTNLYNGAGPCLGPRYMPSRATNSPPTGLPYAGFDLGTNLLVQATARTTTNRTVFIVHNTTGNSYTGNGGIWGRWGADRGIRLTETNDTAEVWWWRDAASVGTDPRKRQLDFINSIEDDYAYWTDRETFDSRQTWFTKEWGITTAYGNHDYGQTSLGVYIVDGAAVPRWWAGGIGEVIVYDRWLSDGERRAVER